MSSNCKSRLVAVVGCWLLTGSLLAVPPGENRRRQQQRAPGQNQANLNLVTEFEGKLKSMDRGILLIERDDGTEVMVKPPEDMSKLRFLAEAKPQFLRPGMMVRFAGTFNRSGVAQSPIAKVELIQPLRGKVPQNQRHRFVPGVHVDKQAAKQQNQNPNQAGGPEVAKCDVVGSLAGIDQQGVMMVRAGKVPVRIPLVPTAKFEICFNNLSLAQPGDPVKVSGFYQAPDETKVVADSITVEPDRVYGEPPAEDPRKQRSSQRNRRKPGSEPDAEQGVESAEASTPE